MTLECCCVVVLLNGDDSTNSCVAYSPALQKALSLVWSSNTFTLLERPSVEVQLVPAVGAANSDFI